MALEYKLEFIFDGSTPSDSSVFIHLRRDMPAYRARIDKEKYVILDADKKHAFITGLFALPGVVELSTKAYRIWVMKSPVYNWQEVLAPLFVYLKTQFSESNLTQLPGSANIDGTGLQLSSIDQRRGI